MESNETKIDENDGFLIEKLSLEPTGLLHSL